MPTRCTEAVTCSGIRNSWPPGCRHAGKPDKPDRTSGRPPALLRPSRSPKSPRPECASVSPWGLAKLADEIWRLAAVRTFFEDPEGRRTLPTSGFAVLPRHYGLNALRPLKVRNGAARNQHRASMRWMGLTGTRQPAHPGLTSGLPRVVQRMIAAACQLGQYEISERP